MNINYKQSQFELFPGSPGSSTETGKPRYMFAHLTLSLENIVVLGIMIFMTLLFSFSLGVEKGKAITVAEKPADQKLAKPLKPKAKTPKAEALLVKAVESVPQKSEQPMAQVIPETPQVKIAEAAELDKADKTPSIPIEDKVLTLMPAVVETKNPVALDEVKSYTIQVASYKGDKYAQKEADVLKDEGFDVQVLPKGDYFIVCVGKFAAKDDANKTLGKLKKKYNDLLVRSF